MIRSRSDEGEGEPGAEPYRNGFGKPRRSSPPQRAPARAKRSLTEKGGQARQLIDCPASLRSDHDPPISLITMERSE